MEYVTGGDMQKAFIIAGVVAVVAVICLVGWLLRKIVTGGWRDEAVGGSA